MKEILPLTSLRFIAALYVFVFHIHIRFPITTNKFLNRFLLEGAVGMSIFFILSGFVLYYRYHNAYLKGDTVKNYITHRFSRIYPIYLLAAVITIPWLGISLDGPDSLSILIYFARILFIVITNIFLIQAWMPGLFDYWNDGGSWSVSTEIFFYSLFSLIQKIVNKSTFKAIIFIGLGAYIFESLCGISQALFRQHDAVRAIYSIPIFRIPEFIIGVVAGVMAIKYSKKTSRHALYFCCTTIVMVIYLCIFGCNTSGYTIHHFITIPLITMMIYNAAMCKSGVVYKALSWRPLVILGHASYSFYSLQAFALFFIPPIYKKIVIHFAVLDNNSYLFIVILISLTGMSLLSYHFIEEPIRRSINRRFCR